MLFKYSFEERKSWLKSFQPNYENQKWHNNKVYHPTDLIHFDFFKLYKIYNAKIDTKDIIGIEYGFEYNCPTYGKRNIDWNYMLESLKRLDRVVNNFKTKKKLISHIHKNNDTKTVLKYGNNYFITSGQHRLCLAKYLEINEVKVSVHEYKLDKNSFIHEKFIKKEYSKLLNYKLVDDKYVQDLKNDFISLKLEEGSISIHKKLVKQFLDRYKILKKKKYLAIPNILKSYFKSINNCKSYRNPNELFTLDYRILKHIIKKQ